MLVLVKERALARLIELSRLRQPVDRRADVGATLPCAHPAPARRSSVRLGTDVRHGGPFVDWLSVHEANGARGLGPGNEGWST